MAYAGLAGEAVEDAARLLVRKAGNEAAEEGAEQLAGRIAWIAAEHGAEAGKEARRLGPAGVQAIEEAGEHAGDVARLFCRQGDEALWITAKPDRLSLFARYGDDVATSLLRHRELADR